MRAIRRVVYVFAAFVLLACIVWWWLLYSNSGARFVLSRAESLAGVQVASADGSIARGLDLQGFQFANDGVALKVEQLYAVIDVSLLPLSVSIAEASAQTVRLALVVRDDQEGGETDLAGTLESLVLPFPLRVNELKIRDVEIERGDLVRSVDTIALSATWFENIEVRKLAVSMAELDADVDAVMQLRQGNSISANAVATLQPALTRLKRPVSVTLKIDGDLGGAELLATVESFATVESRVRWQSGLEATAALAIESLELNDLVDNWPAGFPIDGELRANLDDTELALRDSVLSIGAIDGRVAIDASMQLASGEIDGRLRWERLRWPLPADETIVSSDMADLQLSGSMDDWTAIGRIALVSADLPPGEFEIDVQGDRDSVRGRIIDSEVFGGNIAGEVAYTWRDAQPWSASLDVENVQLAWLLPDWPAEVSGRIDSEGAVHPFAMHAVLDGVRGVLRGETFQADGVVDIEDGDVTVNELRVSHGESTALLDGALMKPKGLDFNARIADLSLYVEALDGEVAAAGAISLAESGGFLDATVNSSSVVIGGQAIAALEAKLAASDAGQSLEIAAVYREMPARVLLKSALADWRKPLEPVFEGQLDAFEIDFGDEHSVTLSAPAAVRLADNELTIDDFCVADQLGGSLCAAANWRDINDYGVQLDLQELSLGIIEHVTDAPLRFEQRVSGTFLWEQRFGAGPRGSGRLTASPGNIIAADQGSPIATGDAVLDFEIENGRLLRGDLVLPFPGRGEVKGDISVADVRLGAESGVSGNLDLDISSIRVLSRLTALVDSASGALQAKLTIGGTVAEPFLDGEFSLENGGFTYAPAGLELSEVNIAGTMDQDYRFDLSGTFRAGKGTGQIVSRADYTNVDEPGLMFRLRGERLTLVNVPDVLVEADTDIDVALGRETLAINGKVLVSNALIKPRNITVNKITESDDVVIVAGELPDVEEESTSQADRQFSGELNVTLGNSVVVDLDLAKAKIKGAANFDWQGGAMPIATGRYLIEGNIEAFGQVLEIADGSVHFPEVPADQPFIRIVAEREIFGNTQVKRAGVLIDGPVRRPTVEAYTQPHTTEERALALLVTGSDFDYEEGVGAIDFGTYIAPRLFVSYGIGVFEPENIIRARFDLTKALGIQVTSGSEESGVDLNYRFEN